MFLPVTGRSQLGWRVVYPTDPNSAVALAIREVNCEVEIVEHRLRCRGNEINDLALSHKLTEPKVPYQEDLRPEFRVRKALLDGLNNKLR